jgi:hypothetical protein
VKLARDVTPVSEHHAAATVTMNPDDFDARQQAEVDQYTAEFAIELADLLAMAILVRATTSDRRVAGIKLVTYMVERYCDTAPTQDVLMMATVTADTVDAAVQRRSPKGKWSRKLAPDSAIPA